MSRPTVVRDVAALTVLALVVRAAAAAIVWWPPYTDPAYYHLVAERLATGHGFTVPVIWSFLEVGSRIPADPVLPVPSNGHWMPLTSIVAAAGMSVFGPTWQGGQVPMVVLGALLVPGTYLVGWIVFASRFVAVVGALLALFAGPLLLMYPTIDNFAVFGIAGAGAIAAAMRATTSDRVGPWLVVSGGLAAVATLARIDGILLALATATAWFLRRPGTGDRGTWIAHLGVGVLSAVAFLAVLSPWLLRNLATYGALLPSTGGHTLWISSYNEQFSIGHEVSAATYLASGAANVIGSKVIAVAELAARAASLMGGVFLLFFIVGSWTRRGTPTLVPFLVYFWVMVGVMALVFTFHAPKGAFYHSAPAWLPFALPLAVAAIPDFGAWAGRAWPFLRRPATHRFLGVIALAGAVVLSLVGSTLLWTDWTRSRVRDQAAASFLHERADATDVVLSTDPTSLHYFSDLPAVGMPFDPFPVIEQVVRAYDVRWVVLTRPGVEELDPLGLWNGNASVDSEGNRPTFLPAEPAYDADTLRIFEVVAP
jgi:hypothetical protein